jgi:hypothetical protein
MNRLAALLACILVSATFAGAQSRSNTFLSRDDLDFLRILTKDIMQESRIAPGQKAVEAFGPNNTGGTLIRPGGRAAYPSFWIRDYAMSLETGMVTKEEQKHMLTVTASTQCDQTWITRGGSMVPLGSIADHIRIDDGLPIYFPGTYSYEEQGNLTYGSLPPFCDQFFFVKMAHYYVKNGGDKKILKLPINGIPLMERLEMAFRMPPSRQATGLVYTTEQFRGVDFGFRDAIVITGELCFASVLKYKAALEMADMWQLLGDKAKAADYADVAAKIKRAIPQFKDSRGMLRACTEKSKQADVWATALAVYYGVLEGEDALQASRALNDAYQKGTLAYKGNIRHVISTDNFNEKTAWEGSFVPLNHYQNGAYWGTPTGWVSYTLAKTAPDQAKKLAKEFIDDLRENDYRKGEGFGAPYECFYPPQHKQNELYLTTVACPYAVFRDGF